MKLINDYQKALDAIYEHVGFKEDWVVYPIDENIERYWQIYGDDPLNQHIKYAENIEQFFSDRDYYQDDIYTQRFYNKWVYEGEDFTMVFCNPGVYGMKWFRLFDNKKRMTNMMQRKFKLKNL